MFLLELQLEITIKVGNSKKERNNMQKMIMLFTLTLLMFPKAMLLLQAIVYNRFDKPLSLSFQTMKKGLCRGGWTRERVIGNEGYEIFQDAGLCKVT
jgi:hypothetical protein